MTQDTRLWRTREAVQARSQATPDATGQTHLIASIPGFDKVAQAAAAALSIDLTRPEFGKFDPISKIKGPPEMQQLYRHPLPECRWDLFPVTQWPDNRNYDFHPYPIDSIRAALQLTPAPSDLPPHERGDPVGPDRLQLASFGLGPRQPAGGDGMVGHRGSESGMTQGALPQELPADLGRGKRNVGKRRQRGASSAPEHSVGSEVTGDTSVHETSSSRRARTDRG